MFGAHMRGVQCHQCYIGYINPYFRMVLHHLTTFFLVPQNNHLIHVIIRGIKIQRDRKVKSDQNIVIKCFLMWVNNNKPSPNHHFYRWYKPSPNGAHQAPPPVVTRTSLPLSPSGLTCGLHERNDETTDRCDVLDVERNISTCQYV